MTANGDREPDLLEVLAAAPFGVVVADRAGLVRRLNPAACELLGAGVEAEGAPLETLLPDPPLREIPRAGALVAGPRGWLLRREAPLPDGGRAWYLLALDPPPRDGVRPWDAWALAAIDPRTGLPGERALRLAMGPQLARCARYRDPLSLVVLEVHAAGADAAARAGALRAAAQAVRGLLRWADLVGVSDHDEVLAVLPETAEANALRLAGSLWAHVQATAEGGGGVEIGVAAWRPGDSAEALIGRARAARTPDPPPAP